MRTSPLSSGPYLLSFAVVLLLVVSAGPPAFAEQVTLGSGRVLQVEAVEIQGRTLTVTVTHDGGKARVDLRFDQIEPRSLLGLLDRNTDAADGRARLDSARLALELGLREDAEARFREAARRDPRLEPARDAGLAAIRALRASEALDDIEARLRAGGDPGGALTLAVALLDGPGLDALTPAQVLRARTLAGLARGLVDREAAQLAAADEPVAPAPAPPPPVAPPPAGAAAPAPAAPALPAALADRVRAEELEAVRARERAADPKLSAARAVRHLETAVRALLAGRRLLRDVPAVLQEAAGPAQERFLELLVATYLDLADLYRQRGRIAEARARVRAVLILDPGNEEALEQRRLIEDDLRRDPYEGYDPYGVEIYDLRYVSGFGYVRTYPYGYSPSLRRAYGGLYRHGLAPRARLGGFGFSLRFGHGHGTHRAVGTRRTP